MVSPRKVKLAAEMEPESAKSSSITQLRTRKTAAKELQATIDPSLERERLIIEGKVPLSDTEEKDSDDEELSDSSGPKDAKVNVRGIMQGFRQDTAFYRSAKHQCEWSGCQFQSGKQRKFMMHVERHAKNVDRDDYVCYWELCDFSAKTKDDLVGHLHYHAFHTKLKVFGARLIASVNLPVCSFGSDNRNKIPNDTNYECAWSGCGMRFNKIMDFGFHLDSHYSDLYANCPRGKKKPLTCQWLGCKFTHRDVHQAKVHGQKHTSPRYIACDNCGHTFIRRRLLVMHCLHAPTEPKPKTPKYKCDAVGCGKEFYRIDAYEVHNRTHYNRPVTNYDCPFCLKGFFSKTWLSRHLEAKHDVSTNKAEKRKKKVTRSVRRRKSYSEEDTSDDDSSDEGNTVDEPAGDTPKQTGTKVEAESNERRYPLRKSGNGTTSVNHRKSTSEDCSTDDEPAGGTPKQTVISVKAEPRSPSCTSGNVVSSLNNGTPKRREIIARVANKRRRSTTGDEDTNEDDSTVEVISVKAEPKEASPRKRTCKTLLDYFSSAKSVNHETPERPEIGARGKKRRKSGN